MTKPEFVYVTYIASTPEKVWNALIDSELTRQYWSRHDNFSDWRPGSRWEHRDADDPSRVDVVGTVVESDRPRRLVVTWGRPAREGVSSGASRVTYAIEPFLDAVRLTVTHDRLEHDPEMGASVARGWPAVLSSLKTLLETGAPLAMTTRKWGGDPPKDATA